MSDSDQDNDQDRKSIQGKLSDTSPSGKMKIVNELKKRKLEDEVPSKKGKQLIRSHGSDEHDGEHFSAEELSRMSRSERKRHREKKRRSDVNKGFDDLMSLLIEIDPDVRAEAEERSRRGQCKGNMGAVEENILSRVDLIARTVEVLRRVHRENEGNKLVISHLLNNMPTPPTVSDPLQAFRQGILQNYIQGSSILGTNRSDHQSGIGRIPGLSSRTSETSAEERSQRFSRALLAELGQSRFPEGLLNQLSPYALLSDNHHPGSLSRRTNASNTFHSGAEAGLAMAESRAMLMGGGEPSELMRRYLQLLQEQASPFGLLSQQNNPSGRANREQNAREQSAREQSARDDDSQSQLEGKRVSHSSSDSSKSRRLADA